MLPILQKYKLLKTSQSMSDDQCLLLRSYLLYHYKQNHLTTLYFSRHIAPAPSIRNTSNAATNAAMHHMTALPHRARNPPGPARFACQQHDAWASLENSSCQRPPSKPRQQAEAASFSRSSGFFRPQYPPSAQHFTAFRCLAHAGCGFGLRLRISW